MGFSLDLLDEVVLDLQQHEQSRRIKKLFFCISQDRWENDSNILDRFALKDLIQETIQANDLENISLSLNEIVESLNRQEVYAEIANDIIDSLSRLNESEEEESTRILVRPKKKITPKQIIPGIYLNKMVGEIENHRQSNRLKKLIFSAYNNSWESDLSKIESYDLKDLILKLRQNYRSLEDLEQTLYRLVESLNRKEVYSLLADSLLDQLAITYQQVNNNSDEETHLMTQMIDTKEIEAVRQAARSAQENSFEAEEIEVEDKKEELTFNAPENYEIEAIGEIPSDRNYDFFELRLKIIQYTNPLRAKNILYSTVFGQNFEDREQCLSVLKNYTLEDLLSRLFYKYKNLEQIEENLALAARETIEPDANLQAVNAIIESIRPIY